MIYRKEEQLIIRDLEEKDIHLLDEALEDQHWNKRTEVYQQRLINQDQSRFYSFVAIYQGQRAGTVNLYLHKDIGPYKDVAYIEDLLVFEKFQRQKIASRLMDVVEQIAFEHHQIIVLAVGLHQGYGKAQRLYIKRGYIPDGSGAWYQQDIARPYTHILNDDHFVVYLEKYKSYINRQ